ncbi:AraC family transcriptional regulator [Lysobacter sp. TY2-98]|uniref:helix-turn-helix transcriptional regulator n=1 Tax=Lysobacter sp. TY2-98 TaxID=2290922 RepID=UPI000E202275|nr:helix-turn-helix transcriptional regulator [Lysobacter sp. TY2-98]AXK72917.1 AraC family transcriptional regulator [Lysobacter sp. TY2-98]
MGTDIHSIRWTFDRAQRAHVSARDWSDDHARLICIGPRTPPFSVPASHVALWLSLRGSLCGDAAERSWCLGERDVLSWPESDVLVTPTRSTWALAACVPAVAVRAWMRGEPPLLLWQSRASVAVLRAWMRLARHVRDAADPALARSLLVALVREQQVELAPHLAACPGRTRDARIRTLTRLCRVRHAIQSRVDSVARLDGLAAEANYSAHHLVRLYRDVFGHTPSEYAASLRHARAWQLVADSPLSISDITAEVGFESPSAFCRAFKSHFGVTATEARRAGRGLGAHDRLVRARG